MAPTSLPAASALYGATAPQTVRSATTVPTRSPRARLASRPICVLAFGSPSALLSPATVAVVPR